jgi:Putative Flp pilus-assembly TadE/G-like
VRWQHDADRGAVAIIVALFAVVLFGFAALVVDVGNAADVKAQASNAADSAALTGERALAAWIYAGNPLPDPDLAGIVETAVDATYQVSGAAWAACTDPDMPPAFTATTDSPCIEYDAVTAAPGPIGSTVRVRIPPRAVPSTFGGLFGVSSISVSPAAAATAGQDPGPACQACNPPLITTPGTSYGQPTPPQATLPEPALGQLPDPKTVALSATDPVTGCPTGPGLFVAPVVITGVLPCVLTEGLYVFDNTVTVNAPLSSDPQGGGVTLVFYGQPPTDASLLTITSSAKLVAPATDATFTCGGALPGVAIVLYQDPVAPSAATQPQAGTTFSGQQAEPSCSSPPPVATTPYTFDLGPSFDITGDVYALDGEATWVTATGECTASDACKIRGVGNWLSVTATAFGDANTIPTVASDNPPVLESPMPEHLSE